MKITHMTSSSSSSSLPLPIQTLVHNVTHSDLVVECTQRSFRPMRGTVRCLYQLAGSNVKTSNRKDVSERVRKHSYSYLFNIPLKGHFECTLALHHSFHSHTLIHTLTHVSISSFTRSLALIHSHAHSEAITNTHSRTAGR